MAGITANSSSKTMTSGDTAADKLATGYVRNERVTLGVVPAASESSVWSLSVPTGSNVVRSALSSDTSPTPSFVPDLGGTYSLTCQVDGVTTYVMRLTALDTAASEPVEAVRFPPREDAQVAAPTAGVAVFYSGPQTGLAQKDSSGVVRTLAMTASVQTYATPGTYVIPTPAAARVLRIPTLIGGGGGGGSGRRGASGTARTGGGGGAGGARFAGEFPADFLRSLGAELTLTIGAGGAGGASIATDNTNGANGSVGGYSEIAIGGNLFLSVRGSFGGNGGRSAFVAAGGVCNSRGTWLGGSGASANADGTVPSTYIYTPGACGGGGAGGGIRTSDLAHYRGLGGGAGLTGTYADQAYPGDPAGKTLDGIPTYHQPGVGGGGGASEVAAPAGMGGAGQCPGGGGGGGGASSNGYASGAGGKGGDGLAVLIWEY